MTDTPWHEGIPIPALMLGARGSYGDVSREALADAGFDDLPRRAGFVIAGLDESEPESQYTGQAEAVAFLAMSPQASSKLIDTLVVRGYLERDVDPDDRRRMSIRLTARGRAASAAIQRGVDAVDAALAEKVTPAELRGLRAGLAALAEIRRAHRAAAMNKR